MEFGLTPTNNVALIDYFDYPASYSMTGPTTNWTFYPYDYDDAGNVCYCDPDSNSFRAEVTRDKRISGSPGIADGASPGSRRAEVVQGDLLTAQRDRRRNLGSKSRMSCLTSRRTKQKPSSRLGARRCRESM